MICCLINKHAKKTRIKIIVSVYKNKCAHMLTDEHKLFRNRTKDRYLFPEKKERKNIIEDYVEQRKKTTVD